MSSSDVPDEKDSGQDVQINFPDSVLNAIEDFLPNTDQFDNPEFNTINYINGLFPTEQSLSNIDSVVAKMEYKLGSIDEEIQELVRGQVASRTDGQRALLEAHARIRALSLQVRDINKKAERSEEMVREITSEIKQLDCAKINLTAAITALNHLHMLAGGLDALRHLTQNHRYKEVVLPLQALMEVLQHLESYRDIGQIGELRQEVQRIRSQLATQIMADFKEAFTGSKAGVTHKTLAEACAVVSVLEPKVRADLLHWFIPTRLQEYAHLFSENQDTAWLDHVERRYAWLKRHLLNFEETLGAIFPPEWELSERIAVQFCRMTREELGALMAARKHEVDVKLLLYAIQKTYNLEVLLDKRFTGVTLAEGSAGGARAAAAGQEGDAKQIGLPPETEPGKVDESRSKSPFIGLIGSCFEPYLYLYIESLDTNLRSLMERFVQDAKQSSHHESSEPQEQSGAVFTSCADLFLFYKKCMVQCTQLTTGAPMLELAAVFQKYLREYAMLVLQASLPKQSASGGVPSLRDLQALGSAGIMQNFQSFLKEGECVRFNKQELSKITSVITTSEYCLETTVHLEQKLKEKVAVGLADKVDLAPERDLFHKIISDCIQLLVQDLELACEPALAAMTKISWQNVDSVGDQSGYVGQIVAHLGGSVPALRDNLASSRKYFTQFCIRFANSFIPKFIQHVYRCKPISTVGSEQLLLDTHMLKTVLLELPSLGSDVRRPAPNTYTKVVVRLMTKAEMILKLVMSPLEVGAGGAGEAFVAQALQLLPECSPAEFQRVLEMKGRLGRAQLSALDAAFREALRRRDAK